MSLGLLQLCSRDASSRVERQRTYVHCTCWSKFAGCLHRIQSLSPSLLQLMCVCSREASSCSEGRYSGSC